MLIVIFYWILGGSAPLNLLSFSKGLCFKDWEAQDLDIWLWKKNGYATDEEELLEWGKDLAFSLDSSRPPEVSFREGYGKCVVLSFEGAREMRPIQLIDVSETVKALEPLETEGAKALGATILDCFDLSPCRVGIVAMDEAKAEAYNEVMGSKGESYRGLDGIERVHLEGGRPSSYDLTVGDVGPEGPSKAQAMAHNDMMCFPVDWPGPLPLDHKKILDCEGLFFVLRPSTLCDLQGVVLSGKEMARYSGPLAQKMVRGSYPQPLARFDGRLVGTSRLIHYARRGYFPIDQERDPALVKVIQEVFLKDPMREYRPLSPIVYSHAAYLGLTEGPMVSLMGLKPVELLDCQEDLFRLMERIGQELRTKSLLKTLVEGRKKAYYLDDHQKRAKRGALKGRF